LIFLSERIALWQYESKFLKFCNHDYFGKRRSNWDR